MYRMCSAQVACLLWCACSVEAIFNMESIDVCDYVRAYNTPAQPIYKDYLVDEIEIYFEQH